MYNEEMEEGNYTDYVWDKMSEDWEAFTFFDSGLQGRLIRAMYPVDERHGEDLLFLHQYVEDEAEYYGIGGQESEILSEKWDQFSKELKEKNRILPVTY